MVNKITLYSILGLFCNDYSKSYYLREIADFLNKPHQTVRPYINNLMKIGVLIEDRKKNVVFYKLNLDNELTFSYLLISEKEALFESINKSLLIKILYEKLSPFFEKNIFIIFGSASYEIKKGSDLDLLIVGKSKLDEVIKEFEQIYNKKIHLVQVGDFNKITNTLVNEIYKKHIILNNTEKVVTLFRNLK